jgi:hypothetical protein
MEPQSAPTGAWCAQFSSSHQSSVRTIISVASISASGMWRRATLASVAEDPLFSVLLRNDLKSVAFVRKSSHRGRDARIILIRFEGIIEGVTCTC